MIAVVLCLREDSMESVIYVKFEFECQYPRQQIFKEIGKEVYYGRDHFLLWHTIFIENKQMILEMVVPKEIVFIICGPDDKKILSSSNSQNQKRFPLLRYKCLSEWKAVSKQYDVIFENGFAILMRGKETSYLGNWLLSFRKIEELSKYDVIEWITSCHCNLNEPEILHTFDYCGIEMQIYRIHKKHLICKKTWYEYYSGNEFIGIEVLS